jgi:Kef-type K+ transport system membrane component KefB
MIDTHIFLAIALILLSTKLSAIFTSRFHMPQVLGALLAGILLGPSVFNLVEPNETIETLAEFGVIILLFSAGMETDLRQLRNSFKSSLLIASLGIAAALGGGFAVAMLFGKPSFESFFIGVIIASTSTSITVEALQEMGKLKTKSGTSIMGTAIIDDILSIVILAVVLGRGADGFSVASITITLSKIIVFFVFAFIFGLGVNKLFNLMSERFGRSRRLSIFALSYCFLLAYIAEFLGLAAITGAYLAGIALCSTRCVEYLEEQTHVLSYMIFTPIFIANIGLQTTFEGLDGSRLLFTAALVGIAIISKMLACGFGAKICRFSNKESAQIGIGMVSRGEVTIIVAAKGLIAGFIEPQLFSSVIAVILVTVIITPILLRLAYASKAKPELQEEKS